MILLINKIIKIFFLYIIFNIYKMNSEIASANLTMTHLNNSRNKNELSASFVNIKNNFDSATKNLDLILKELQLDSEITINNLKSEIADLSNTFYNVLNYQ